MIKTDIIPMHSAFCMGGVLGTADIKIAYL